MIGILSDNIFPCLLQRVKRVDIIIQVFNKMNHFAKLDYQAYTKVYDGWSNFYCNYLLSDIIFQILILEYQFIEAVMNMMKYNFYKYEIIFELSGILESLI